MPKALIFSWLLAVAACGDVFAQYSLSLWDIPVTVGSLAVSLFGDARYRAMEPPAGNVKPKSDLLPWDRPLAGRYDEAADKASDWFSALAAAPLALGGYAWYRGDTDGGSFAAYTVMYAQVVALQNGLNLLARSSALWPRPYIYGDDGASATMAQKAQGEAYGSFFSGHASAAFTTAVFIGDFFSEVYPNSPYKGIVWATSLSLASFVGVLRVAAGKHYPTDVVAGALVGTGVSLFVLKIYRNFAKNAVFSASWNNISLNMKF